MRRLAEPTDFPEMPIEVKFETLPKNDDYIPAKVLSQAKVLKNIKRCPFCGEKAEVLARGVPYGPNEYVVICSDSKCRGGFHYTDTWGDNLDKAVEMWNMRAGDDN